MVHEITFWLHNGTESMEIACRRREYRNLMTLINEMVFVEDFGECRGIGRCGTCLVEIQTKMPLPGKERNEQSTLDKCAVKVPDLRLACQIMIDERLQDAQVRIVEEREDVR